MTIDYWTSPEAKLFFNPLQGESVTECLLHRIEVLNCASTSDDILISLIDDVDTIDESSKQRENLRMQCLCLKNAYLNAIQYMNIEIWTNCCEKAISFMSDIGISYINNEKTIRKWNQRFRKFEKFDFPYGRQLQEPKLFDFFLEA